jgi:hypothetical protein
VQRGNPEGLLATFQNKIWSKRVAKDEVARYQTDYKLVLSKLSGGKMIIHIFSETDPGNGFAMEQATLEDIYFANIA